MLVAEHAPLDRLVRSIDALTVGLGERLSMTHLLKDMIGMKLTKKILILNIIIPYLSD